LLKLMLGWCANNCQDAAVSCALLLLRKLALKMTFNFSRPAIATLGLSHRHAQRTEL